MSPKPVQAARSARARAGRAIPCPAAFGAPLWRSLRHHAPQCRLRTHQPCRPERSRSRPCLLVACTRGALAGCSSGQDCRRTELRFTVVSMWSGWRHRYRFPAARTQAWASVRAWALVRASASGSVETQPFMLLNDASNSCVVHSLATIKVCPLTGSAPVCSETLPYYIIYIFIIIKGQHTETY